MVNSEVGCSYVVVEPRSHVEPKNDADGEGWRGDMIGTHLRECKKKMNERFVYPTHF